MRTSANSWLHPKRWWLGLIPNVWLRSHEAGLSPYITFEDFIMNQVFTPVRVGRYTLQNRLAMAPMTRSRAELDGTPGELVVEYYAQRADIGLIVTEGTQPSDDGQGYLTTPGIYTNAHVAGWQKVTSAVHAKNGRIFIQL